VPYSTNSKYYVFCLTSLGEAAARTKATDQKRRETPTIRPGLVGIRRDPKWLDSPGGYSTSCSAKAQLEGVCAVRGSDYAPSLVMGAFFIVLF